MFNTFTLRSIAAAVVFFALVNLPVSQGDEGGPDGRTGVIQLRNGDHLTGTLVNSAANDSLLWQSTVFASPFQFPLDGVVSVHFPAPATLPQLDAAYGFELAGGDLLFGELLVLNGEEVVIDVPRIGRLNIDRSIVRRIFRRTVAGEQLFVGPTGLNGWKTSGDTNAWHEEAGHLIADKPGAVLWRDFGFPNQVRVEFELSWTTHPDFELAIGVGDDPKSVLRAFRFEVWESEIVVQRETEKEADVVSLQKIAGKSGRLHVQAFLDQKLGRMLVFSSGGEKLADLSVASSRSDIFGGIQLVNRKGDIRLERLQIARWVGEAPRFVQVEKSRIHNVDGTINYAALKSFDVEKHEFVLGDGDESQRVAENTVNDVFLTPVGEVEPRPIRCAYLSGMKISGNLNRVDDQKVSLKTPGILEPIVVPLADLQSLIILKNPADPPELPQRRGRLEVGGMTLHGCLVDGVDGENSCLQWQPLRSANSSPLQKGISARIVYRDPPPVAQPNLANVPPGVGVPGRVVRTTTRKTSKKSGSVLHLRTGDTLPCEPISVDEKGLTFKSTVSEATFVPHDQIKVLELIGDASPVEIAKLKKDRLLTVPRMQRDNPPTHLIRSIDGDYLRGRLIGMDETQLQVELRLEGKIVRRERIARIIWLHPESLVANANGQGQNAANSNLVQALPSDGNRLTFRAERINGSILSGRSELLGVCRVDLQNVDQLLIGAAIEQATAELAFHQWKLKAAAEPLAPQDDADDGGNSTEGQESVLIGKAAPDIQLKKLDGTLFKLDEHKGKVVILDFWASWCGPCMQVMPMIDKVAEEFADQGVELFGVNLEESPEKIKTAQERLKLSTTVLLDRDGRIAERYGATSIPQTVIINRDGTVARLFVGGSSRFDEQLRTALKSVLSAETEKK